MQRLGKLIQTKYQFSFLKRHSPKSLPASLFKGRRAFLNAFDKRFRFFPPVEWRQAYSTGGRKGDLTAFQMTKVLPSQRSKEGRWMQFYLQGGGKEAIKDGEEFHGLRGRGCPLPERKSCDGPAAKELRRAADDSG